ncbi:XRE family transcriptional regulator [Actinomadura opuntiae]|uniref:XRE family transcriptional regulator n=1 Tax=Actinomadura sp. OS1-43 TaxID=604315 RepID=UPI00255AFEA8|nr:XRE family transcriptional regulator [Actinomadura sp. OS1-43]MDL4816894.1 XRE family transcriptional regulator [Actinomadura sp. OS1-43]
MQHEASQHADLLEKLGIVNDYGHQIYRRPLEVLVPALTADIIAVGELLKEARPPREQTGLLRASAGLTGVLAETLAKGGDDRAARRAWNTARRAADASGDRVLRVWVRGRAAQHAGWAGSSHQTLMTMVRDAEQIAGGVPSSGLARAYAAGAYGAASYGDIATARANLDKLKRTFERLSPGPGEPTILDFQESQLHWNEAYVHVVGGDKRAVATVEYAEKLYPSTANGPLVNLHLMRAIDLIKQGELGVGAEVAVTSLAGQPRPAMAQRQLVGQVLETLPASARALPAARELRSLISAA